MFDVAGLIGKADETATNPAPKYLNYADFVRGVNDRINDAQKEIDQEAVRINNANKEIDAILKRCDLMQTTKEAEKDEKKMLSKIE